MTEWMKGRIGVHKRRLEDPEGDPKEVGRYRRLWYFGVLSSSLVSIIPLIIMFVINFYQYQKAFQEEVKTPIRQLASNVGRSLEFFLEERRSALNFIIHEHPFENLQEASTLQDIFQNLTLNYEGFVDLGLIDPEGEQLSYVGPYSLTGKQYKGQPWFHETIAQSLYVSDVFLGYRNFPHFVIAVAKKDKNGNPYILRATLNASVFDKLMQTQDLPESRDAFIINREGVLQTPSKRFGTNLKPFPIKLPLENKGPQVTEIKGDGGGIYITGFTRVARTPYTYVAMERTDTLLTSWFALRKELVGFLALSIVLILIVIFTGSAYLVGRIRDADEKRLAVLHNAEYTAKMASIGRLAAGVAHEINNPLAIINEKAGLIQDYLTISEKTPPSIELLKIVEPIIKSVERCSRITRRLLGFAKHVDVKIDPINLENLLLEVLGFLEKEASYRDIVIKFDIAEGLPEIKSDRGSLQQVFLNIINNAFAAVDDGGHLDISARRKDQQFVTVSIKDNGVGIKKEFLNRIFEPFFTTKEKYGTGLGLSITYGIVQKLGGTIDVDSQDGEWTRFDVTLPIEHMVQEGRSE